MASPESDIETRVSALETRVGELSERIEALSRQISALRPGLSFTRPEGGHELQAAQPRAEAGRSPLVVHYDLFTRLATVCFLLVVALVLRVVTENGLIRSDLGAAAGISYCCVLVIWSLLVGTRRQTVGLVVGVCGLGVLCLVVFETYRYFGGLSLTACFWVLLVGMLASILVAWRHHASPVGWLGLIIGPVVFTALTFPIIPYSWLSAFAGVAVATSFLGHTSLGLWPARSSLALLVVLMFLNWSFELSLIAGGHPPDGYEVPGLFLPATLGFGTLYLLPPLVAALRRRTLSVFEKIAPSVAVLLTYRLVGGDLYRRGAEGHLHASVGLALAVALLGLAVWLGLRDRRHHYGLRTFLCAGVVLLLVTSRSVLQSTERLAVLWSSCALALFMLAAYFRYRSADLRFISYLLHMGVVLVTMLSGALTAGQQFRLVPTSLALFLSVATLTHYLASKRVTTGMQGGPGHSAPSSDQARVALFVCFVATSFVFGKNILVATGGSKASLVCGESIWLTILATITLLAGARQKNRELFALGLLVYGAAAVKVLLIDLFQGMGAYLVVSVFTFGTLAGISSYFMRSERKKRT